MKKSIKVIIGLISCLVLVAVINVQGYTYDFNGDPIHSPDGFVSTVPKRALELGIDASEFNSPEDLFVYTETDGTKLIYIADSASNTIFIFDSNYKLVTKFSSVFMNPSNFTDKQLQAIKSDGKYVIARDQAISIPYEMEKISLVLGDVALSEKVIDFEVHEEHLPEGAYLEWSSDNIEVANLNETFDKIVALKTGTANIIGQYFIDVTTVIPEVDENDEPVLDENGNQKEETKTTKEVVEGASVSITVTVVDNVEDIDTTREPKNNSFSLNEIKALPKVELQFSSISSIYRAETPGIKNSDYLYISDTQNNQIYVVKHDMINNEYEVVNFVTIPSDSAFANKTFQPVEVITDAKGRIYVIANNIYEGIIQFNREGEFDRFTGVNYVTLTPWEIFWRNLSTDAQLAKQSSIINTSFTGMTVDKEGFIYATSYALTNDKNLVTDDKNMIKRINPFGKDVLRRNGYQAPMGDVEYLAASNDVSLRGPSRLTGVTVNEYGMYTVLDSKKGNLFTYDREGNLLYISGKSYLGSGNPSQLDILNNPVAIEYFGEDILVLDKNKKSLLVFEPTVIGKLINEAVKLEYVGNNIAAAEIWEQVVTQNANYEYAYIGIGRKYMALEEYDIAMQYFKDGKDRELYSRAFKMVRDAKVREYFAPVMGSGLVLIIGLNIFFKIKNRGKVKTRDTGIGDE